MARCPKCRCTFRVMEDEDPRDFGCPRCGYGEHREAPEQPHASNCSVWVGEACSCATGREDTL